MLWPIEHVHRPVHAKIAFAYCVWLVSIQVMIGQNHTYFPNKGRLGQNQKVDLKYTPKVRAHLMLVQAQGWLQYYNQFKERELHNSNTPIRYIILKEAHIHLPLIIQKIQL